MEQNNIWMCYLTLGLITNLILVLVSCVKTDRYGRVGEYHFINETNHVITYPRGFEKYNIGRNSKTFLSESDFSGKNVNVADYISPLLSLNGRLTIKFDNNLCLINEKMGNTHSVMDIENYVAEKIDQRTYKFTYTFTEADYNRAVACP